MGEGRVGLGAEKNGVNAGIAIKIFLQFTESDEDGFGGALLGAEREFAEVGAVEGRSHIETDALASVLFAAMEGFAGDGGGFFEAEQELVAWFCVEFSGDGGAEAGFARGWS